MELHAYKKVFLEHPAVSVKRKRVHLNIIIQSNA